jgi:hypothetical protein
MQRAEWHVSHDHMQVEEEEVTEFVRSGSRSARRADGRRFRDNRLDIERCRQRRVRGYPFARPFFGIKSAE